MKFLLFLGSVRESTPPRPARLGYRVALACEQYLRMAYPDIEIELIDPLDPAVKPVFEQAVFKPQFSYAQGKAPVGLEQLAQKISLADGYVMISPEYNHSLSPALAHLLNHFGSSRFAFKPSAIVTYSAGQWGGMRAGVGMRTFLGELGCLPVSAMVHLPHAQNVFDEQGQFLPSVDVTAWQGYFGRTFSQLVWWATATKNHRQNVNPNDIVPPFVTNPSERNAPN
ncbi:NAD(P)H-dependent oxidoreductase [Moraxella osloensis]|nr:NAD(P)H-dependent oxidoreductase [Moraxella osloensis]QRO12697.1 NAD(P)H-dependent oxidoreductase [Moraxella osloensis]